MGRGNTGSMSARRAGGRRQDSSTRGRGFGPKAALAAGINNLSRKARYHLKELALAKKRDLELAARDHAVRLLMSLKNEVVNTAAGVIRIEDLPTAVGALVAVPVLDQVTTRMLNAAGQRTKNPSQEELLFSRYSSAMGFGQSSKCFDYNIEIDSPLKMPRKSGVREVSVPIYQGNKVLTGGKWDESESVYNLKTGYNGRVTRFFTEMAGCLAEKELRRLVAPQTRQRPTICSSTTNPTYFDVDSTKDILTDVYSPFSIKSKTTITNINSNFGCKVTIRLVTLTDMEGQTNNPIDYFSGQYNGTPDMYKLREDDGALVPVSYLDKYVPSDHHSLGQSYQDMWSAAECQTHVSKNIFADNQGQEKLRVLGSKTFTLQPGETVNCSVTKYYNENFAQRGNISLYPDEWNFCGDQYTGLVVELTGVRGSVYEAETNANGNVIDREFDYGFLPAECSVITSQEMCNYWKTNPLFGAGDPVAGAASNILYQSVYQRDAMGTADINLPTYYLRGQISSGEELIGPSTKALIVPVNTSREVRAAGTGIRAQEPVEG